MDLDELIGMSRKYGSDPDYVLAGGGNTSCKEEGVMAVKASGYALAAIEEDGFVLMDVRKLLMMMDADYPEGDKEREALALRGLMAARLDRKDGKRPSVECIMHALFPFRYVLHLHPALINGLACSRNGAAEAAAIFADVKGIFLWIPLSKPGYTLSKECASLFAGHESAHGRHPSIVLLQNHGVFVAADSVRDIDGLMADVVSRISKRIVRQPDPVKDVAIYMEGRENEGLHPSAIPFTPDHVVYRDSFPLVADSVKVKTYSESFGGPLVLPEDFIRFIENWESESYRQKQVLR